MHDLGPKIRQALSSNDEDDDAVSRVSQITYLHSFTGLNGLFSRTTWVRWYETDKTSLDK